MHEIQKIERTSANIQNENLEKLRAVFPQFVKDDIVDFDALQAFFDRENILAGSEKYGLSWAGKSEAFKAIRVPATGTLVPDERGVGEWDKTQNIFIEGDNLEVLKLLQKHYREQVKMIYIDPPYNTGKDFIYKDNFTENKSDYYERTGQSEGGVKLTSNPESNGRYHSDWLTMMYPRLFLAKNLLKDDGVIFISIDDNEVANLRLVMDEIFGEENFVAQIVREQIKGGSQTNSIRSVHDYVLVYAKHVDETEFSGHEKEGIVLDLQDENGKYAKGRELNKWGAGSRREDSPSMWFPIPGPNGEDVYPIRNDGAEGRWRLGKTKMMQRVSAGDVIFEKRENGTYIAYEKVRNGDSKIKQFTSLFKDKYLNAYGTEMLKSLLEVERAYFDYSKPIELIKDLIVFADADTGDIILDFFAGSGTTAHAVMAQNAEDGGNRKWICVQLPEETAEDSEARKAGYNTISEIAIDRIRRLASYPKMKEVVEKNERVDFDFGFKSFKLASSNYRQWSVLTKKDDEAKLKVQMKLFADKPLVDGADEKSVVYEVLLKEGFDLNTDVKQEEKGNVTIWSATSGDRKMVVTLVPKLSREQVDSLGLAKEDTFVCLDSALDDSLKVNLSKNFNLKVI